jgi:hypothetical protein
MKAAIDVCGGKICAGCDTGESGALEAVLIQHVLGSVEQAPEGLATTGLLR